MKRWLAAAMAAVLLLFPCAPESALASDKYDALIRYLDSGDYEKAFMEVARFAAESSSLGGVSASGQGGSAPEIIGNDWCFHMDLINYSDAPITLREVQIVNLIDGNPVGDPFIFSGDQLDNLGLKGLCLAQNEGIGWDDAHPIVSDFNSRDYIFLFKNPAGEEVVQTFTFDMTGSSPAGSVSQAQDWVFEILLRNDGTEPLYLQSLTITDLMNEVPCNDPFVFGSDMLPNIDLGEVVLQSGDILPWRDGHPAVDSFNGRDYSFTFTDGQGNEHVQSFVFSMAGGAAELTNQPAQTDYSSDKGQNLLTLRHDADFSVQVAPGIFWVPAAALGQSRYSNADVYAMLARSPEDKQEAVSTLYEALQLYQIGNFHSSDDNIRLFENGVNWEHHKPGYDAVRTNNGCCATDSNWLNYILRNDYEEIGYIATSQRDGSGHIYNYILHEGWYYFIDLTHYRTDWIATAQESGNLDQYYATDFVLGNIHKAASVDEFVSYVQDTFGDPPGLMFRYTAEDCLAVDSAQRDGNVYILYEEVPGIDIHVIYDDPDDNLEFQLSASPQQRPDWSAIPGCDFPQ